MRRTAHRLLEVMEFVPAAEVDPDYLDTSYYIAPALQRSRLLLCQPLSYGLGLNTSLALLDTPKAGSPPPTT